MIKKLLSSVLMAAIAAGAMAHGVDDMIYTRNAKYKVTGPNLVTNGELRGASLDGWTATDATAASLSDVFTVLEEGGVSVNAGMSALVDGMYQVVNISDAGTYVVTMKVRGDEPGYTDVDLYAAGNNYIFAYFNTDGTLSTKNDEMLLYGEGGAAIENCYGFTNDDFTELAFPVEAASDGKIVIDLRGLAAGIEIHDVECHQVQAAFDERKAERRLAWIRSVLGDFEWSDEYAGYSDLQSNIQALEGALRGDDDTSKAAMLENLEKCFVEEFAPANLINLFNTIDHPSGSGGDHSANWMNWTAQYDKCVHDAHNQPWVFNCDRWAHKTAAAGTPLQVQWPRGYSHNTWDPQARLTTTLDKGAYRLGISGSGGMMTMNKDRMMRSGAYDNVKVEMILEDAEEPTRNVTVFEGVLSPSFDKSFIGSFTIDEQKEVTILLHCYQMECPSDKPGADVSLIDPVLYKLLAKERPGEADPGILDPVSYWDPVEGVHAECTNYTLYDGQTTLAGGWWVVEGAFTNDTRIKVSGEVHLLLADGAELVAANGIDVASNECFTVWAQSTNDAAGKLVAQANVNWADAGIGSSEFSGDGGTITINGGTVTATGGGPSILTGGAGIGGGYKGSGGSITINGGTVEAKGGTSGAGIGGGYEGAGGTITISGGTVEATGGYEAAAIGGGKNNSDDGSLLLDGMKVTEPAETTAAGREAACRERGGIVKLEVCEAHEFEDGACKWCGGIPYWDPVAGTDAVCGVYTLYDGRTALTSGWWVVKGSCTNDTRISVSGEVHLILCYRTTLTAKKGINVSKDHSLTVYEQSSFSGTLFAGTDGTQTSEGYNATCDNANAGIGGGHGAGGTITINGGWVVAMGGKFGAGIGGGRSGAGGTVTINGGMVTAQGGTSAAGIGGGDGGAGGTITINGGSVEAKGSVSGAGIGGGYQGSGGSITINGGDVRAWGISAAGIGGGYRGAGGTITISGGMVEATGSGGGTGIGGGDGGAGGTITINGGTIRATGSQDGAAIGGSANNSDVGSLLLDGMKVTEPAGTLATNREAACRVRGGSTVKLEVCEAHEYEDGACKWCGGIPYWDPVAGTNAVCGVYTLYDGRTSLTSGWWVVKGASTNGTRITVSGEVHLLLADGAELTANAGIDVASGESLTIWAQSTNAAAGKLTASAASSGQAGIGGGNYGAGGTITINGGMVAATGGTDGGAGIGGGFGGAGGDVTLNGGTVAATGGEFAEAIGGGYNNGNEGSLILDGMKVTDPAGTLATNRVDACRVRGGSVTLEVCHPHEYEGGACKWCGAEGSVEQIEAEVSGWEGSYDGVGHGVTVRVEKPETGAVVRYQAGGPGEEAPGGEWSTAAPLFTNACSNTTVWVEISAEGYPTATNRATVTIAPAPLTITAKDQTHDYDGMPQGEGDTVYATPEEIAAKVEAEGLQGDDRLASLILDGQATEPGTYTNLVPSAAQVCNGTNNVTGNYTISYVAGTLTIREVLHTVAFTWHDGSFVTNYLHGTTNVTVPSVPSPYTDPATGTTNVFDGWVPAVAEAVTNDATYEARYLIIPGVTVSCVVDGPDGGGSTMFVSIAGPADCDGEADVAVFQDGTLEGTPIWSTNGVRLAGGKADFTVSPAGDVEPGNQQTIAATYHKNERYAEATVAGKVMGTSAIVIDVPATNYVGEAIVATLSTRPGDASVGLEVTLRSGAGGAEEPCTVVGNQVTFAEGLPEGDYVLSAHWGGNIHYVGASTNVGFTVVWRHPREEVDGVVWFYEPNGDGATATVVGVASNGATGNLVMPDTLGGLTVTAVGNEAFVFRTNITGMEIAAGVTNIGDCAFFFCTGLTDVTISDLVTDIGERAFDDCRSLTNAWLGTGIENVGENAFRNCTSLAAIWIPVEQKGTELLKEAGLRDECDKRYYGTQVVKFDANGGTCDVKTNGYTIGEKYGWLPEAEREGYDFTGWWDEAAGVSLATNDTVTEEASRTVYARWEVIPSVIIDGVRWIYRINEAGAATVVGAEPAAGKLVMPDELDGLRVTAVGEKAFAGCTDLQVLVLAPSVNSIGGEAFDGCTAMVGMEIPEGVEDIGPGAFAGSGLVAALTPDSVTNIADSAYAGCTSLTQVWIGQGVESVGTNAFGDCSALSEVWIDARWRDVTPGLLDAAWGENGEPKPDGVLVRYYGAADWFVRADGDDANDGYTPATAKREISAALAVAAKGNTVWVGPGTYGAVEVPAGVSVMGEEGAGKTIIGGAAGVRCAALGEGSLLSGFTLEGGETDGDGGGALLGYGSELARCVVKGCKAGGSGGAVAAADSQSRLNVLVENCLLVGNETEGTDGGAADGVMLVHCTVAGNKGAGVKDCDVANSVICGNDGAAQAVDSTVTWSLCEGAEGEGNIEGDPMFEGEGDWHLQSRSPCIDAAADLDLDADLDGSPRPQPRTYGQGAAARPDMGCYEYTPKGPPTALFVSPNGSGIPPYDSWDNAAPDIQSAVDVAQDGDIVVVGAGTYGPVSVGTAVTVVSLRGAEETIIDAQDSARAVELLGGGTLEGFTVVNGSADDCGGILAEGGSTVRDVIVVGCGATGSGGGVCLYDESTAENVIAVSNSAAFGGGVYATGNSVILRCEITANAATESGGGVWLGGDSRMEGGTLRDNTATGSGGGAYAEESVLHNIGIYANRAARGGGIFALVSDGHDCVIATNSASEGAALWLEGEDTPQFWNHTIVHNFGPGAPVVLRGTAILGNTIVWANTGGDVDAADTTEIIAPNAGDPGFLGEDDYHLVVDSPCIGQGVIQPWMQDAYDMDGQGRIVRTETGSQVDIGADSATLDAIATPTADSPDYTWRVIPNSLLQLQSTPSLVHASWQNDGPSFSCTNFTWSFTPPPDAPPCLFYRLLWLSP